MEITPETYHVLSTLHDTITILRMRAQEKKLAFRAQAVSYTHLDVYKRQILYRLENEPAVSGGSAFTDVESGAWYADAVAWAAANDIVNGTSATTFAPNSPITREQMAAILYRYAAYKGYDVSQKADLSGYTDAASISDYAKDALAWANAQKLITGVTDTTLNPQGSATRAQVATILMRLCETVVK